MSNLPYPVATSIAVVVISYLLAAWIRSSYTQKKFTIDPIKLSQGPFGRASLSTFQILFFTVIVYWIALYLTLSKGSLPKFGDSVALLLGITAIGSAAAKIADAQKGRLGFENWAWLKAKNWIRKDITKSDPNREARWGDLLMTDQGFEVERFQALVFTLVIGLYILRASLTDGTDIAKIDVPPFYLALMGISQAVYVGGKMTSPPAVAELDQKLTQLRSLETKFMDAVARTPTWSNANPAQKTLEQAQKAAPDEFHAFQTAVEEAAEMVAVLTSNTITKAMRAPNLPA